MNTKRVTFVVKTSKFCNLRCLYCYEYHELSNRAAMTLEQLDQVYTNIASYYHQLDYPITIEFNWHGGEPLLRHPDYYWQTLARQKKIFGSLSEHIINTVQTNLTFLNNEHIPLLKNCFDYVGVYLDLFGDLRVNPNGTNSQPSVLNNINKLLIEKIPFGCITVLTQLNLNYIEEIYNFYQEMNINFSLLPLFNGAFEQQHQGYEINADDIFNALSVAFELWLISKKRVQVQPIAEYIQQIVHYYTPDRQPNVYDKRKWESIYLVNLDGNVYSYADVYITEFTHGNLFTTSLEDIIKGFMHLKAIESAEKRMSSVCNFCSYFGSCSGYPMAEESIMYNQVDEDSNANCTYVKRILKYIDMRFKQVGIINPITHKLNLKRVFRSDNTEELK